VTETKDDTTENDERGLLTRRADLVRSRMLRRIDALDERRHAVSHALTQVTEGAKRLLPVIVGVSVASVAAVAVFISVRRARHAHALAGRVLAFPIEDRKPGLLSRALRALAIVLATRAARRIGQKMAERALRAPEDAPEELAQ
jgi:hypothetical protein